MGDFKAHSKFYVFDFSELKKLCYNLIRGVQNLPFWT